MKNLLVADIEIAPNGLRGIGPLGLEGKPSGLAAVVFSDFLTTLIGVMTIVGFVWFLIQLLIAAVSMIGSGGDKAKMEGARTKITSSLIGLVLVIAAVFLIELIGSIFGIDFLHILGLIDKLGGPGGVSP